MNQIPILFLGDSPDLSGGLSRIGRDLACNLTHIPQFRVGYLGRDGFGSRKLPFMQYNYDNTRWQWGEQILPRVWEDFAGDEKGIIFTVWDASRLFWFGCPHYMENPGDEALKSFLTSGQFQRWGYFAIDSTGPHDKLTALSRETLLGYDRILAYTSWGSGVMSNTVERECEWIPHGINLNIFEPKDKKAARMAMGFKDSDLVIGFVGTNQPRKDWGLFFGAMSDIKKRHDNLRLWCHIDVIEKSQAWSIHALVNDFGFGEDVLVTQHSTDEELAYHYSGCDLTLLPSLGEGFGYPIVESLGCGTPIISGNYGGGAELVPHNGWLVEPREFRLETLHNCLRPVYRPEDWVDAVELAITGEHGFNREACRASVDHLDWKNLWPVWEKWYLEGLEKKLIDSPVDLREQEYPATPDEADRGKESTTSALLQAKGGMSEVGTWPKIYSMRGTIPTRDPIEEEVTKRMDLQENADPDPLDEERREKE